MDIQTGQGAVFAHDRIPLHFGDQAGEYRAALDGVIVLDRSHEARLEMTGRSALDILHRISTNDLLNLAVDQGCPTILTNPIARILDRIVVFRRSDRLLVLGEPGRGPALGQYLQRNIFFGDEARIHTLSSDTHQFDLHGPLASHVIQKLMPDAAVLDVLQGCETAIDGEAVYVARRKPVIDQRWTVIAPAELAGRLWLALTDAGVHPAGSLVYNILRVRAGLPSVGRELSTEFIPLEIGLWDEVSFSKGCYTGQEIIARMESRNRLAKTIVSLGLDALVDAPASIFAQGHSIGQLTSSVIAPDGEIFAIGVVKPEYAEPGKRLEVGDDHIPAQVRMIPAGAHHDMR